MKPSRSIGLSILAFVAGPTWGAPPDTSVFYGLGRAADGDSLMVGDREVRLFGVDAPEFDQVCQRNGQSWACGTEAAHQLSELVTGRDVRCVYVRTDEYGRSVARCTVGTTDVGAAMVERGYALAYRHYSTDYVAAEGRAKAARRGLWSGTFEEPRSYRVERRGAASSPQRKAKPQAKAAGNSRDWANRSQCVIKGNRNRRGQFIYHLPGMPYYDQTRPEEIFCTEAEARAAGYRRAIVK